MNKRQRRKIEQERVAQLGSTEQQKATRYFNQQIDEIRSFSKRKVM